MKRKYVKDVLMAQKLAHLPRSATVREAAELMATRRIGAVLVVENARVDGIFTERDMIRRLVAKGLDPNTTRLEEVMTTDPTCVGPKDKITCALRQMAESGYRHLPVVDDDLRAVGIVSMRDFMAAEIQQLKNEDEIKLAAIGGFGHGA